MEKHFDQDKLSSSCSSELLKRRGRPKQFENNMSKYNNNDNNINNYNCNNYNNVSANNKKNNGEWNNNEEQKTRALNDIEAKATFVAQAEESTTQSSGRETVYKAEEAAVTSKMKPTSKRHEATPPRRCPRKMTTPCRSPLF
ncbi:hypothetical protein RND81_08G072100 [Saponaria officinalis]|uniref:Uncharacterized protein n=1 Tax=Saponaria officinalis TaxID=3572 RepID=A0AAW1J4C2_SAPOF